MHFATYGFNGRFNLVKGKNSQERTVARRLSLLLGYPVNKESGILSVICIKCKREIEKLETLENSLTKFRQKALESAGAQKGIGICGQTSEEVPQKFPNHKESDEESACKVGYTIAFLRKTKTDFKTFKCLQLFSGAPIP